MTCLSEQRVLARLVAQQPVQRGVRHDVVSHGLVELVLDVARIDLREQRALLDLEPTSTGSCSNRAPRLGLDLDRIDRLDDCRWPARGPRCRRG